MDAEGELGLMGRELGKSMSKRDCQYNGREGRVEMRGNFRGWLRLRDV